MNLVDYYLKAAEKSKWDLYLWLRYLNKTIQRDKILLTKEDVRELKNSNTLRSYQKVLLDLAVTKGTNVWEFVVGLSEPYKPLGLQNVLKQLNKENKLILND